MSATPPRNSRTLHRRTSSADAERLCRQPACHQSSHCRQRRVRAPRPLRVGPQGAPTPMTTFRVRNGQQGLGMNYQDPFLFKPDQLMSLRPPLLRNYLDPATAVLVSRRACDPLPAGGPHPDGELADRRRGGSRAPLRLPFARPATSSHRAMNGDAMIQNAAQPAQPIETVLEGPDRTETFTGCLPIRPGPRSRTCRRSRRAALADAVQQVGAAPVQRPPLRAGAGLDGDPGDGRAVFRRTRRRGPR